jgi:alkylation response protein AidB-like acyl-CoA dehydrogenase
MSSTSFTFDLDDVHFTLFDQLDLPGRLAGTERYADLDRDIYEATIGEAHKLATEVIAPLNAPGDREGCHFDGEGGVTTPKGYVQAWKSFAEGGWAGPRADPEVGGAGMPHVIAAVLGELFSGACIAFNMYPLLSAGAARVIHGHAPKDLANPVAEKMFTGEWGGTMCLTEAGAGSAVGDNRAKATPTDEEGVYLIEGEKIFISGGDQDLVSNICHLVLARTPGAPNGTKGLSLFLVPKFWFDRSMKVGERNGAYVVSIEHKMGIHGNATCVLGFGDKGPCKGYLLGEENQGIRLMFEMMNEARIGVGLQGLAMGSSAYQYALHYANERVQGTALAQARDPDAPRVKIVEHPDVRRMLMSQKVLVETMRSMAYRLCLDFDASEHHADEAERTRLAQRVDLLVPIVKAMCTDLGFDVAVSAVQVYGGYGYIGEFPVEQIVRDAKIQSIYEGTNGIQALDLLGRKMRLQGGKLFMDWMSEMKAQLAEAGKEGFEAQATAIGKAIDNVGAAAMKVAAVGQGGDVNAAMVHATPFMQAFGFTVLATEALDQARVAKRAIDAGTGKRLHKGKLLNLDFCVSHILTRAVALAKSIQLADASCLDDELFQV